jgi:protein-S-isoprenylcysteine O-methyltransferase Ste14
VAAAALGIYALYLALAFGLRTLIQLRRTGESGFKGLGGKPGSAEWIAGVGFAVALLVGAAAPILDLAGVLDPIAAIDSDAVNYAGAALALAGVGLTLYAQIAMGESWRIGVDESERTSLVTSGPFGLVRNPIFSAMIPTAVGLAMMVPNVASIAGLVGLIAALELQVRVVEEPYLRRVHGQAYESYAARVGRFFPGLGRIERRTVDAIGE